MASSTQGITIKEKAPKMQSTGCLVCLGLLSVVNVALIAVNLGLTYDHWDSSDSASDVKEPPLPGVMPGKGHPKIILGQDIDWPPYAYLAVPPEGDYSVAGFGADIGLGLSEVCDIEVVPVQTKWGECWGTGVIGEGIASGEFHGCMTYTHTVGTRPRVLEFTNAVLSANKPAGILTLLGPDGKPTIDPTTDDLTGKKIVDVAGWAPTADGMALVTNKCTGNRYTGMEILVPDTAGNDAAMAMLRNGQADGMWVYADQAYNYRPNQQGVVADWDTALWTGHGTKFAYIATGMLAHSINGTTLAISKKGSGLADILNPCLQKFMATESYYNICTKHSLTGSCFPNSFFPSAGSGKADYELPTNEQIGDCSDGYCACDVGVTSGTPTYTTDPDETFTVFSI